MSVNRATNVKQRDADIARKLQLYSIGDAFQRGKMPSNEQIDVTLNSFLQSKALTSPSRNLSSEGRTLVADLRNVVQQAKVLLLSKNEGNLIQDFFWQTGTFDYSSIDKPGGPTTGDDAKQDGDKALQGLKTLGNLLITNGQFRKLLNDASVLFRDILADSATSATSKIRPSEEALSQIDEPAADNTWHETPDFSKDNLRKQAQGRFGKKGKTDPSELGAPDPLDAPREGVSGISGPGGVAGTGVSTGDPGLDEAAGNAQEAAKTKAAEYRERSRAYLEQKVPQERRDQAVWRLKKMIIECQQHPDYQDAVETLLNLAEKYQGHALAGASSGAGVVSNTRGRMAQAEADLKLLLERFANGTSSDGLWSSINAMYVAADKDTELKTWFRNIDRFVRRCLQERGYVLEDVSTQHWHTLQEQGQYLLRDKYRKQVDRVTDQVKFMADQFDADPQNQAFAAAMRKLFTDLGNDENGRPVFKPHLVKDLTGVILPAALESIAYVPVPRIEYVDQQIEAVVEGVVVESDNFTPNLLEIFNNNHIAWGRKMARSGNLSKHAVQINVSGIQMDMRNVNYYIKRKQGFPAITDKGIASLFLGGSGFGFQLGLSTADPKDREHFFKVNHVRVDLDHLKITLHKSQHKMLFAIVKPLLLHIMRPVLQKVLEKAIRDNFRKWDATAYDIKQEADANGPDSSSPNSYKRFMNVVQKRSSATKEKKRAEKNAKKARGGDEDKKLNMALAREDSILPNITWPSSFTDKASEYRTMARSGDKWQSPVFTLGSAGHSHDIPRPPKVENKHLAHNNQYGNGAAYSNGQNGAYTNGQNGTNGASHNLTGAGVAVGGIGNARGSGAITASPGANVVGSGVAGVGAGVGRGIDQVSTGVDYADGRISNTTGNVVGGGVGTVGSGAGYVVDGAGTGVGGGNVGSGGQTVTDGVRGTDNVSEAVRNGAKKARGKNQ